MLIQWLLISLPNLWLFNPENDLALAAGVANYTPPKSVVSFRTALAVLPVWLAEPGDNVVAPGVDGEWLASTGLDVGINPVGQPRPWGWSADAVRQFHALGVQGPFPDVEVIRRLSHRRTAQRLYDVLRPDYPRPLEINDVKDLPATDRIVLKSPWSCSGRGVVDCSGMSREAIVRRASDTIRRQGSVMVEPLLPKVRDFAMLFDAHDGIVSYHGLSLFFNCNSTAYSGNIVAPEAELIEQLGINDVEELSCEVASALTEIIGFDYDGPLGVDMMLYGDERKVCPTVEINLRYTMGFVARALQRRFGRGTLNVTPAGATFTHTDGRIIRLT